MIDVGGLFYRPSVKDLAASSSNVRRFTTTITASASATTVQGNDSGNCPPDIVRYIHTVDFGFAPGAAQFALYAQLLLLDPATNFTIARVSVTPGTFTAAQASSQSIAGLELTQMQGELLQLTSAFNAGANANAISCFVQGWEFPRGTLQR